MNIHKRRIISGALLAVAIFLAIGSTDSGSSQGSLGSGDIVDSNRENPQGNPGSTSKPDLEVLDVSTKTDQFARYAVGTVLNNTKKNYSYVQVEVKLLDKSGNVVGSTLDNVNNLGPGEKWKFKAIILEKEATKFEIEKVTGY